MDKCQQVFNLLLETGRDHLYPYLLNDDIGKIDSALTEKCMREIYLNQASDFYLTNSIHLAAELDWIMKRGISLTICRLDYGHNSDATHQGIYHLLPEYLI